MNDAYGDTVPPAPTKRLAVVHLSDFHILDDQDPIAKRGHALAQSLKAFPAVVTDCVLAITGDIAFSGLPQQYAIAKDIILNCVKTIRMEGIEPHIVIVPGNHDCDFSEENPVRTVLLDTVKESPEKFSPTFLPICCATQSAYTKFENEIFSDRPDLQMTTPQIYKRIKMTLQETDITFHLFNTAWCSRKDEQPGTLCLPDAALIEAQEASDASLNIALLHHTLNWLAPDNARNIRALFDEATDIVLTGHEHKSALRSNTDMLSSLETVLCEGDVMAEHGQPDKSAYNVILLDLSKRIYMMERRVWRDGLYQSTDVSNEWFPLTSSVRRPASSFYVSPSFLMQITEPGAAFKHPRVAKLTLDDMYVSPELRELEDVRHLKSGHSFKKICFCNINFSAKQNHYLILGTNLSGKTSLCYQIFKKMHKSGRVPIYLDMSGLRSGSIDNLERLIEKAFKDEYQNPNIAAFQQIDHSKKILLFDNFHLVRLNAKARMHFLHEICTLYSHVLVTGDSLLTLDEITEADNGSGSVPHLRMLQLLPFGHVLRSDLITKWIEFGQADTISHQELAREHDELKLTVDSVLGENLVPSYPLFLLIILQRCDSDTPHDIQSSAYGYYYEYLIIQSLRGICKKNEDIDAYYNYITELANYLFEAHLRQISEVKLQEFHEKHCKLYRISADFSKTLRNLISANILLDINGDYRFRYPYVYYFFVARYLANNMTIPEIKHRVNKMCDRIYQNEFANIIMFLTHLSKDPIILENILSTAKKIFPEDVPYHFDKPINAVLQLLDETPQLALKEKDVRQERRKQLEEKDETSPPSAEKSDSILSYEYDLHAEIKDPNTIEHFIMSLKTIEVLGQLLKNYYGSLKADPKLALAEETYLIALRSIRRFYDKLVGNLDGLVAHIQRLLHDLDLTKQDQKETAARQILFVLCLWIPDIYIQHVTRSLANRQLAGTFSDVVAKHDTPGVRLIDLSIKMACQRAFPIAEAAELAKEFNKDPLAQLILKNMVLQHLYLFPRSISERQSICARLNIPLEGTIKLISGGK